MLIVNNVIQKCHSPVNGYEVLRCGRHYILSREYGRGVRSGYIWELHLTEPAYILDEVITDRPQVNYREESGNNNKPGDWLIIIGHEYKTISTEGAFNLKRFDLVRHNMQ